METVTACTSRRVLRSDLTVIRMLASASRLATFCALSFGGFQGLMCARTDEVFVHSVASLYRIARANCLVDAAMEFGGFSQIAIGGLSGSFSTPIVVQSGYHFDERCDDGITGCRRYRTMKSDVVYEEAFRIIEGREQ